MLKIKVNENLQSIFTYIQNYEYHIDLSDLVAWCVDYEYYKELYENYHVIKGMLDEHNEKYTKVFEDPQKQFEDDSLI